MSELSKSMEKSLEINNKNINRINKKYSSKPNIEDYKYVNDNGETIVDELKYKDDLNDYEAHMLEKEMIFSQSMYLETKIAEEENK